MPFFSFFSFFFACFEGGGGSHFVAQAGQGIPDNHLASVSLVLGYQV